MFDARVMKCIIVTFCHPKMHTNVFGSWAPPGPAGELKCSPDSLATMGKGMGKGERRREGVGSRNITLKSNNFVRKEKEYGRNCKLFRLLRW